MWDYMPDTGNQRFYVQLQCNPQNWAAKCAQFLFTVRGNSKYFVLLSCRSLNIWRHTSKLVINAIDRPLAGLYTHLWPIFITLATSIHQHCMQVHAHARPVYIVNMYTFTQMASLYPMKSLVPGSWHLPLSLWLKEHVSLDRSSWSFESVCNHLL